MSRLLKGIVCFLQKCLAAAGGDEQPRRRPVKRLHFEVLEPRLCLSNFFWEGGVNGAWGSPASWRDADGNVPANPLSATVIDRATEEPLAVSVNWGDGQGSDLALEPGATSFALMWAAV
ncbi:MAG: hypothetical protein HYS13_02240 [Planctomycetia bacterium]|nr:hypothetical protein [Planctomycetia bacterium]